MGAEELLVFPVLLRDRGAMADLVRTVLGPLTRARGGAEPLLRTLAECAASGYVNAEAARRLGISVRTLPYRSERVRTLTGYSPAEPLQCFTLEAAVMGRVECERARRTAGTDGGGRCGPNGPRPAPRRDGRGPRWSGLGGRCRCAGRISRPAASGRGRSCRRRVL